MIEILPTSNHAYEIIHLEQRTQEWHNFRKGKLGSSAAAVVMEVSPWDTPLSLWESMQKGTEKKSTPAMQRGIDEEPIALQWFCGYMGRRFSPCVLQSINYPKIIASLDGFDFNSGEGVEIKVPGMEDHLSAIEGIVPEKYKWQIQHQMFVSGAERWFYFSWWCASGVTIEVKRDNQAIERLVEAECGFLDKLEAGVPPCALARDWVVVTDVEACSLAQEYLDLDQNIKKQEKRKAQLKERIIDLVGLCHPRTTLGFLSVQKVIRKGAIDYDAIEVLRTIDLEKYRKPCIESWRLC